MQLRRLVSFLLLAAPGCALDSVGDLEQAVTVCARGPTVAGIDVSKWQADIDWDQVAGAGVKFAFIRVNHGLDDVDEKFPFNWPEARRVGIARGAYQYFLPNEDAVAQADLFLELLGSLEPGDLPPVLDVENTGGGMSPDAVAERVGQWMARVEPALGVKPIIYTGKYFWQDNVGSSEFVDHPLWIASWSATCPDLPQPWSDWLFHQTSDDGRVAGISGPVDTDLFNGSIDDLRALGRAGGPPCAVIEPDGGVVDDTGPCFHAGGDPQYIRIENAGYASFLRWTHATDLADPSNYGVWDLHFAEGGRYRVEAYTPAPWSQSHQAVYQIRHAGKDQAIEIDQSAIDGWTLLGELDFAPGGSQSIRVDDNTGEPNQDEVKIVFDAIRLTRLGEPGGDDGGDDGGGDGADDDGADDDGANDDGANDDGDPGESGCAVARPGEGVNGGAGQAARLALWLGLGLLGLLRRRRA